MKLEPFQVADKISACNKALEGLCKKLDDVGQKKVEAEVEYDKQYEIALAELRASDTPIGVSKEMAKGILARKGTTLDYKLAEVRYKALYAKIDAAKASLCAWQSYYKHLDVGIQ